MSHDGTIFDEAQGYDESNVSTEASTEEPSTGTEQAAGGAGKYYRYVIYKARQDFDPAKPETHGFALQFNLNQVGQNNAVFISFARQKAKQSQEKGSQTFDWKSAANFKCAIVDLGMILSAAGFGGTEEIVEIFHKSANNNSTVLKIQQYKTMGGEHIKRGINLFLNGDPNAKPYPIQPRKRGINPNSVRFSLSRSKDEVYTVTVLPHEAIVIRLFLEDCVKRMLAK